MNQNGTSCEVGVQLKEMLFATIDCDERVLTDENPDCNERSQSSSQCIGPFRALFICSAWVSTIAYEAVNFDPFGKESNALDVL